MHDKEVVWYNNNNNNNNNNSNNVQLLWYLYTIVAVSFFLNYFHFGPIKPVLSIFILESVFPSTKEKSLIWGSHGSRYEGGCLLGGYAMWSDRRLLKFQRCVLSQSSGQLSQKGVERAVLRWKLMEDSSEMNWNILKIVTSTSSRLNLIQAHLVRTITTEP
jgi:hypothetical protein